MITKFKLFESVNDGEPELGDYVICHETSEEYDDAVEYINNNIGKIIYVYSENEKNRALLFCSFDFMVKYDIDFEKEEFRRVDFQVLTDLDGCRKMERREIKYWSKNKEDLESILAINKYNL